MTERSMLDFLAILFLDNLSRGRGESISTTTQTGLVLESNVRGRRRCPRNLCGNIIIRFSWWKELYLKLTQQESRGGGQEKLRKRVGEVLLYFHHHHLYLYLKLLSFHSVLLPPSNNLFPLISSCFHSFISLHICFLLHLIHSLFQEETRSESGCVCFYCWRVHFLMRLSSHIHSLLFEKSKKDNRRRRRRNANLSG